MNKQKPNQKKKKKKSLDHKGARTFVPGSTPPPIRLAHASIDQPRPERIPRVKRCGRGGIATREIGVPSIRLELRRRAEAGGAEAGHRVAPSKPARRWPCVGARDARRPRRREEEEESVEHLAREGRRDLGRLAGDEREGRRPEGEGSRRGRRRGGR